MRIVCWIIRMDLKLIRIVSHGDKSVFNGLTFLTSWNARLFPSIDRALLSCGPWKFVLCLYGTGCVYLTDEKITSTIKSSNEFHCIECVEEFPLSTGYLVCLTLLVCTYQQSWINLSLLTFDIYRSSRIVMNVCHNLLNHQYNQDIL